jgi:adenine-specific DNA-methyltransferase
MHQRSRGERVPDANAGPLTSGCDSNYKDRSGRSIQNDSGTPDFVNAFGDLYRVLKPNSFCVCFYGWNRVDEFFRAWRAAGFRPAGHIVWEKRYTSNARFLQYRHEQAYLLVKGNPPRPSRPLADVQPWQYSGNTAHPTEKAVSVLKPLIQSFSKPGDIVLDPFAGSGSTALAAALSGRRYIGIELEGAYCRAPALLALRNSQQERGPRMDQAIKHAAMPTGLVVSFASITITVANSEGNLKEAAVTETRQVTKNPQRECITLDRTPSRPA